MWADMPFLRAYRHGELTAQEAINRARFLDEAEAIIEAARRADAERTEAALAGLGERFRR